MLPRDLARLVINRSYIFSPGAHTLLLNAVKALQGLEVRFGAVENRIILVGGDVEKPGLRIIRGRLPVNDTVGVWRHQGTPRRCVLFRIADRPSQLIYARRPIQ